MKDIESVFALMEVEGRADGVIVLVDLPNRASSPLARTGGNSSLLYTQSVQSFTWDDTKFTVSI